MDLGSTEAIVLEALQRASSQDAEVLKPAEAKLKEWELQPGFYSVLFVSTFTTAFCFPLSPELLLEHNIQSFHRLKRQMDGCVVFKERSRQVLEEECPKVNLQLVLAF